MTALGFNQLADIGHIGITALALTALTYKANPLTRWLFDTFGPQARTIQRFFPVLDALLKTTPELAGKIDKSKLEIAAQIVSEVAAGSPDVSFSETQVKRAASYLLDRFDGAAHFRPVRRVEELNFQERIIYNAVFGPAKERLEAQLKA